MNSSMKQLKSVSLIVFALILGSCGKNKHEYHSLVDKIEDKSVYIEKDSIGFHANFEPDQLVEVREKEGRFFIGNRKKSIKSYACTECHSSSVEQLKTKNLGKKAHWDIELKHADRMTMDCMACHNDANMDQLKSITNNEIDFSHSYQLCGQCHQKEQKDWAGGAHGKNLSGWKSIRVSKTCVECHNPHQPAIESRWPSRYNSTMVKERH